MISRRSSGSMRAASAVEPTRPANITVTCRRSAELVVGTFAASLGVVAALCTLPGERLAPHSEQNLASAVFSCPHAAHARGSAAPHWLQNLAACATSTPQLGQFIG